MRTKLYLITYVLISYGIIIGLLSLFSNFIFTLFMISSIITAYAIFKITGGDYEDT